LAVAALWNWLGGPGPAVLPVTPFHAAGTSFLGALGIGISQSIWNYSGWDNASTLGGEIEQAGRTYPRALARTLPLVTVVYLLAADVFLYTAALALEFAALIRLRRKEPGLRGSFRVPVGVPVLVVLAALPVLLLLVGVALEVRSREIGLPGVLVAAALSAVGIAGYGVLRRAPAAGAAEKPS